MQDDLLRVEQFGILLGLFGLLDIIDYQFELGFGPVRCEQEPQNIYVDLAQHGRDLRQGPRAVFAANRKLIHSWHSSSLLETSFYN